jgi:hypothetical protein
MKGIKKIMMLFVVLGMVLVFAATASARWYTVNVINTNIYNDGTVEMKVEGDGRYNTFVLPNAYANQFLAMALTAQSGGLQLKIDVNWGVSFSEIAGMKLLSGTP